jgi:ribosomal protein L40E
MNDLFVFLLLGFVVFGAVGWLIGQRKGRPIAGLVWAMVLGPIGWLLILLGPSNQDLNSTPCPHCGAALPIGEQSCRQCGNAVRWLKRRAIKPPRAA